MVGVFSELLELRPDDADLAREVRSLRLELGLPVDEVEGGAAGPFGKGPRSDPRDHGPGRPLPPAGARPDRPPAPREPPLPLPRGPPDHPEDRRPRRGPDPHRRGRDPPAGREDDAPRGAIQGKGGRQEGRGEESRGKEGRREGRRGRTGRGQDGRRERPGAARTEVRKVEAKRKAVRVVQSRGPRRGEGQHGRHLRRDRHHPLHQRRYRRAGLLRSPGGRRRGAPLDRRDPGPPAPGERHPARAGPDGDRLRFPQGPAQDRRGGRTPRPTTSSGWRSWARASSRRPSTS